MLAPIAVTVILLAYFAVYFAILIAFLPGIWKYILAIIPAAGAAVLIGVCIQRIREITKGEEDDLSQY